MIRAWAEDIARKVDGSDTEGEDSETSSDTGTVGTPMSVDALTQVWQKTRNQLDAAKALLEKRDRAFQKHLHQKLEAQNQEFQQKLIAVRRDETEIQSKYAHALETKATEADAAREQVIVLESRVKQLEECQESLEATIKDMENTIETSTDEHKRALLAYACERDNLKSEFIHREKVREDYHQFEDGAFALMKNREIALEADKTHHTQSLVTLQCELEGARSRMKSLQAEKLWGEAQSNRQIAELQTKLSDTGKQLEIVENAVKSKEQEIRTIEIKVRSLEDSLSECPLPQATFSDLVDDSSAIASIEAKNCELEKELAHLSEQLVLKHSAIETLTRERNTLSFQLENESRKSAELASSIAEISHSRSQELDHDIETGLRKRDVKYSNGLRSRQGHTDEGTPQFVSLTSSSSNLQSYFRLTVQMVSLAIANISRKHPWLMSFIVSYIVVLHLYMTLLWIN